MVPSRRLLARLDGLRVSLLLACGVLSLLLGSVFLGPVVAGFLLAVAVVVVGVWVLVDDV